MQCTEIQERLPWLLNGTLDDDERRVVEGHLVSCENCQAELKAAREASNLYAAHPLAENLVDYALGRPVTGLFRTLLEGHLAYCTTCAEDVALVQQDRLAMGTTVVGDSVDPPAPAAVTSPHFPWRTLALAASVVAALGVGGLVRQSQRSLTPSPNVAVVECLPESFVARNDSENSAPVDGTRATALIFTTDRVETYEGVRIRFADPAGRVVWESEDLEINQTGDFTVLLPPDTLPGGENIVTLEMLRDGAWSVFETYRLDVSP